MLSHALHAGLHCRPMQCVPRAISGARACRVQLVRTAAAASKAATTTKGSRSQEEALQLATQIVPLKHHGTAAGQAQAQDSSEAIQRHAQLLKEYSTGLRAWAKTHWPALAAQEVKALQAAAAALAANTKSMKGSSSSSSSSSIHWFQEWGCALLAVRSLSADGVHLGAHLDHATLHLVAADEWRYEVHMPAGRSPQRSSWCASGSICHAGSVPWDQIPDLVEDMRTNLSQRLAHKKATDGGGPGFNYTPGLVLAACEDVLGQLGKERSSQQPAAPPLPGFTDVGQHTGCEPRATSWPLVREVHKALLMLGHEGEAMLARPPEQLHAESIAHYELWLLQQQVQQLTPATATTPMVTTCMQLLQSAVTQAGHLHMAGSFDAAAFEAACTTARAEVEAAVQQRALLAASANQLPPEQLAAAGSRNFWRLPQGVLPGKVQLPKKEAGANSARQRAADNLGTISIAQPVKGGTVQALLPCLLSQLQQALQLSAEVDESTLQLQHVLSAVDQALFGAALAGFAQPQCALTNQAAHQQLADMVDRYREVSERLRSGKAGAALLQVELHSRQILVAWVAYCILFQATRGHPVLKQYGVALRWQDLQHLVLSDRQATDAALAVAAYLQKQHKPGKDLFSLRDQGSATFDMARQYAAADEGLQQLLTLEQAAAERRTEAHWAKVSEKKKQAQELRKQLSEAQAEQKMCIGATEAAQKSERPQRQAQQAEAKRKVAALKKQLKAALVSPPAVIQPLPSSAAAAGTWLFFLHMPEQLRVLSRATFLAQQLVLPRPVDPHGLGQVDVGHTATNTSIGAHHSNHRSGQYGGSAAPMSTCPTDGAVVLHSSGTAPKPGSIQQQTAEHYTSRSHGVWHPDDWQLHMNWKGSGSAADKAWQLPDGFFNPVKELPVNLLEGTFTEQLPRQHSKLQWALWQPGELQQVDAERGNRGVATRCDAPAWLDHPAWLSFSSMRAYPLQQLQRLCAALREQLLPWGHPAVRTLVQMTMYQLGQLVDKQPSVTGGGTCAPRQLGRTGWDQPGRELPTLVSELSALAEQLQEVPREHDTVLLLGELAAYLSDWSADAAQVARRFAAVAAAEADSLQAQIDSVLDQGGKVAELKAKQCKSRMLASLCYGAGPLGEEEVQQLLTLLAQIKHAALYTADAAQASELSQLRVKCHAVIARQLPSIHQVLGKQAARDRVLTAAASAVISQVPSALQWQQLPPPKNQPGRMTGSYEATATADGTEHLYSINVLDGTVLLDGLPLSRLPSTVLQHPLYKRSFGSSNFEVQRTADGVLETVKPMASKLYRFCLPSVGLLVEEVDWASGGKLELLDPGSTDAPAQWACELPLRLRTMHSHWLDRERGCILLRPVSFHVRDVNYILTTSQDGSQATTHSRTSSGSSSSSRAVQYTVVKVPRNLRSKGWPQLVQEHLQDLRKRHLVLPGDPASDPVLSVLSKFEDKQYIHVWRQPGGAGAVGAIQAADSSSTASGQLVFELPRYNLEFQLQQGKLWSMDHVGWYLAPNQQLVNFTPGETGGSTRVPGAGAAETSTAAAAADSYTLPGFSQYLVLQQEETGSSSSSTSVLMPAGRVTRVEPGSSNPLADSVRLSISSKCDAALQAYLYDLHPRFHHLVAPDIPERLQLAALYATASSLLPEPTSRLTGAQTALQLLRQCWHNGSLSDTGKTVQKAVAAQLQQVAALGGHLLPALHLMVEYLQTSKGYLNTYLYTGSAATAQQQYQIQAPYAAADAYRKQLTQRLPGGFATHPCNQLSPAEEQELWQMAPAGRSLSSGLPQRPIQPLKGQVPACPVPSSYVDDCEQRLLCLVVKKCKAPDTQPYPLAPVGLGAKGAVLPLEKDMHNDLRTSWEVHHAEHQQLDVSEKTQSAVPSLLEEVEAKRQAAEHYLLEHLSLAPDTAGLPATPWRLLKLCGLAPTASLHQLLPAALSKEELVKVNPLLSDTAVDRLHQGLLTWLQLCVLEDRLQRLQQLLVKQAAGVNCTADIIKELSVHRTWDVTRHPRWLVFEVEGRLQIRPLQQQIAQTLIDNPGAVVQLNMGEGKTRVILPMLALHWADGQHVVALNILSTLLPEAYRHLHRHLTASALGTKLYLAPFDRDVPLDQAGARALLSTVAKCKREGGVLLLAPEHRNSLYLKAQELALAGDSTTYALLQQLAAQPWVHLVDESDELLHYRYQLVYAVGDVMALPSRDERVAVVQALLQALNQLVLAAAEDPGSCPELTTPGLAQWSATRPPGGFAHVHLLPGRPLQAALPALSGRLLEQLLREPPYELGWLAGLSSTDKDQLRRVILDPAAGASQKQLPTGLHTNQLHQVLALRGLLAGGILAHVLQKRHLVDYGVNRGEGVTSLKRLAVPYRAANTPAPRTEFSHPDVALVATQLSYYDDGLSLEQLQEALGVLLRMEPNAQAALYELWLQQAAGQLAPGLLPKVDNPRKLDPTNAALMATLHSTFSHNMEAINFWLRFCVFTSDTQQYPQRLMTSAWHLAAANPGAAAGQGRSKASKSAAAAIQAPQSSLVGFSGTKDNHRLLPAMVQHKQLLEPQLAGTDGRMSAALLDPAVASGYITLPVLEEGKAGWQVVLDKALESGCSALLDCGALLAEADAGALAHYLLPVLDPGRHQGVCLYDPSRQDFMVVSLSGAEAQQHASPIKPAACFTIYDEARCRGTDLKLAPSAKALLTLGPGCAKDKLMQAAGRLRQLAPGGQTLLLAGPQEVTGKIWEVTSSNSSSSSSSHSKGQQHQQPTEEPSMTQVLNWVMANTVQDNLQGVATWVAAGLHYHSTFGRPQQSVLPELLELEEYYGSSKAPVAAGEVLEAMLQKGLRQVEAEGDQLAAQQMREVVAAGSRLAQGHKVVAGMRADEECERELQREQEQEQEEEVQLPRDKPTPDQQWQYESVLANGSPCQLPVDVTPLADFVKCDVHPPGLGDIPWSRDIYVTKNFWKTIHNISKAGYSEYLRPVNHLLVYPSGQVLLLSDREADGVLRAAWGAEGAAKGAAKKAPQLMLLAYADPEASKLYPSGAVAVPAPRLLSISLGGAQDAGLQLTVEQLVSLQLFNGCAMYSSQEQREVLVGMVRGRREEVEALLALRGKLPQLPRSHLEQAADVRLATP